MTNRRAEPLRFGSPTTHGRPAAGYTGLFWRGPRGASAAAGSSPPKPPKPPSPTRPPHVDPMGCQAPWPGLLSARHDGRDGHATLLFEHAPRNDHPARRHPPGALVRRARDPFAAVAPSWAFHEELVLPPGETLARAYRVPRRRRRLDRARSPHTWPALAW